MSAPLPAFFRGRLYLGEMRRVLQGPLGQGLLLPIYSFFSKFLGNPPGVTLLHMRLCPYSLPPIGLCSFFCFSPSGADIFLSFFSWFCCPPGGTLGRALKRDVFRNGEWSAMEKGSGSFWEGSGPKNGLQGISTEQGGLGGQ